MNDDHISFERAKDILARAAAIEAQTPGMISLADVREIGHEAGIDARAVELAIAEERGTRVPRGAESGVRRWPLVGVVTGAALGAGSALVFPGQLLFLSLLGGVGGVMMTAGVMAAQIRGTGAHRQFQLSNLALWISYSAARLWIGGVNAYFATDVVEIVALAAASTGMIGAILITTKNRSADRAECDSNGSQFPGLSEVVRRIGAAAAGIWSYLRTPLWRSERPAGCSHAG